MTWHALHQVKVYCYRMSSEVKVEHTQLCVHHKLCIICLSIMRFFIVEHLDRKLVSVNDQVLTHIIHLFLGVLGWGECGQDDHKRSETAMVYLHTGVYLCYRRLLIRL